MIRRFLTRVLLIVLIAACGYNWLQTQRLQGQVFQLQAEQRISTHAPPQAAAQRHTPEARISLAALKAEWKHLQQNSIFRSTSKKVFHELPI